MSEGVYVCPLCGSRYFSYTDSRGETSIFQLGPDRDIEVMQGEGELPEPETTISCGSCSWKGKMSETVYDDKG